MAENVRPIPDAVAVLREAREILALPGMAFDSPTARRLIGDLVWLLTDPASDTQRAFELLRLQADVLPVSNSGHEWRAAAVRLLEGLQK